MNRKWKKIIGATLTIASMLIFFLCSAIFLYEPESFKIESLGVQNAESLNTPLIVSGLLIFLGAFILTEPTRDY